MSIIPLFFVHTGYQNHLKYVLSQAKKTNKEVYLLGDDSNKKIIQSWYKMEDFIDERFETFKSKFINMSTNPSEFELNCFKRYFVCYKFAKTHRIETFFMMDSDCLVYFDLSLLNLQEYDVGASFPEDQSNMNWTASPHASLWTVHALDSFLNFLIDAYNKDNIYKLEQKWEYHKKNNISGGICDMTLLYLWILENELVFNVFNTSKIHDGKVFDHFLNVTEGYKKGDFIINKYLEMKVVKFVNNVPYFKYKDGSWVQTCTIHAQGARKKYIIPLSSYKSSGLLYYGYKISSDFYRIKNFITRKLGVKK